MLTKAQEKKINRIYKQLEKIENEIRDVHDVLEYKREQLIEKGKDEGKTSEMAYLLWLSSERLKESINLVGECLLVNKE